MLLEPHSFVHKSALLSRRSCRSLKMRFIYLSRIDTLFNLLKVVLGKRRHSNSQVPTQVLPPGDAVLVYKMVDERPLIDFYRLAGVILQHNFSLSMLRTLARCYAVREARLSPFRFPSNNLKNHGGCSKLGLTMRIISVYVLLVSVGSGGRFQT